MKRAVSIWPAVRIRRESDAGKGEADRGQQAGRRMGISWVRQSKDEARGPTARGLEVQGQLDAVALGRLDHTDGGGMERARRPQMTAPSSVRLLPNR